MIHAFFIKKKNVLKGPIPSPSPAFCSSYLQESRCFWPSAGKVGPQTLGVGNSFPGLGPYCPHQTLWHRSEVVLGKRSKRVFVSAGYNNAIYIPPPHLLRDLWWAQVAKSEGWHGGCGLLMRALASQPRGGTSSASCCECSTSTMGPASHLLPPHLKALSTHTHYWGPLQQDYCLVKSPSRVSLVAQWLRVCLPMQGTRVRALVWEDPTCRGATGPVSHNYWACASGACAPQQERPQ